MRNLAWVALLLLAVAVVAGPRLYSDGYDRSKAPDAARVTLTRAEGSLKSRLGCCAADEATVTSVKLASTQTAETTSCPVTGATLAAASAAPGDHRCSADGLKVADGNDALAATSE